MPIQYIAEAGAGAGAGAEIRDNGGAGALLFCLRGTLRFIFVICAIKSNVHYYTMILLCIRIIVGDAVFEPGTSAPDQ